MARRSGEGEGAYTVEFWESVDTDVDPLLVDARRGLRGWHGGVLHRRRRWDSHGADGAACKHEQRVSVFVRFASLLILRAVPAQPPSPRLVSGLAPSQSYEQHCAGQEKKADHSHVHTALVIEHNTVECIGAKILHEVLHTGVHCSGLYLDLY